MHIAIQKNVLGEDKHLVLNTDNNSYRWVGSLDDDMWIIGRTNKKKSINELCKLSGDEYKVLPPDPWANMFKVFLAEDPAAKLRWRYILPDLLYKEYIQGLFSSALRALASDNAGYYNDVFKVTRGLLENLECSKVNEDILYHYYRAEKNPSVKSTFKTFFPKADGLAKKPIYEMTSTITGRLTIKHGPRILTLPKDKRNIFSSNFKHGKVKSLDFKSIEPRIALILSGRDAPEDIYADLQEKVFNNLIGRDLVKVMCISLLYGAQEDRMSSLSGLSGSKLRNIIEDMTSYFGTRAIKHKLVKQYKECGYIKNYYGRIIKPIKSHPSLLYNYYIQSTSVDASLLGFAEGKKFIDNNKLLMNFLFVIHDAVIIDVHPEHEIYIQNIMRSCSAIPGFQTKFYMKQEDI